MYEAIALTVFLLVGAAAGFFFGVVLGARRGTKLMLERARVYMEATVKLDDLIARAKARLEALDEADAKALFERQMRGGL